MSKAKITKQTVDSCHPGERDDFLWDTKIAGFGVKVTPAGRKVYIYQYRLGGRGAKVRRYTIGRHGDITADNARNEAKRLAMLVSQGVDPQSAKVEQRRQAIDLAFPAYLNRFAKECLKPTWKASADEVEAMLRTYALPVLKSKALPQINRRDVSDVLRPLKAKPATASKMYAVMRRLFRWAISEGDLDASPMEAMEPPPKPEARDRWLNDRELLTIWKATGDLGYPFGPMFRLLILSGARRNEVSDLSWTELSKDQELWSLPAARAKNGEATTYPLSSLMMDEIDKLAAKSSKKGWPRKGLVFTTTGETPVSGFSRAKKRLDALIEEGNEGEALLPWTIHDLRRTLATGMQRLGVRFEVTEALLNHKSGSRSGVAGIYQQHSWGPEKRAALQAWSDHVERLDSKAHKTNVIPISASA